MARTTGSTNRDAAEIELVWEEPPEPVFLSKYTRIIEQLKANPDKWARIRVTPGSGGAYSTTKTIKKTQNSTGVETKVVNMGEKGYAVYGRYVSRGNRQ